MKLVRLLRVMLILVVGSLAADILPETTSGSVSLLDCTNDLEERMFCQFEAQNCSEHNVTLRSGYGENKNVCRTCDPGHCCCSVLMGGALLIPGDTIEATVWKDGIKVVSKEFPVLDSVKPKAPTIESLRESNGNIELKWKSNVQSRTLESSLTANVTYYRRGHREKQVTKHVASTTFNNFFYYEIPVRDLEPSTTYVFSVRSHTSLSGKYSDSSEEREFTTGVASDTVLLVVIASLSLVAVTVTALMFGCYVKLKKKWWDTTASPKVLIHPNPLEFLKPEPLIVSPIIIMPPDPEDSDLSMKRFLLDSSSNSTQESSGISTASSSLSYANTEPATTDDIRAGVQDALQRAFPGINPTSPVTTDWFSDRPNDTSSGSSGIDNRTYSMLVINDPQQSAAGGSEAQTPLACVSAYHPSEGDPVGSAEPAPAGPGFSLALPAPALLPTDMSYHQCRADSAYAEDSSLSSVSSGGTTAASSRVDPGLDEADVGAADPSPTPEAGMVCDENPCYGHVPPTSPRCPLVVDDYQAFQSLVKPDVLIPAQIGAKKQDGLDPSPEPTFTKIPPLVPAFINSVPGGQCLPHLQRPMIPLMSSHVPVLTYSDYQSV